ncbi:12771_t:CDS:2 [Funneliformis mosseae]|uniref:12771_t:CDS:1 n=1 Tax=Funneliformis mosseae TaxID=27381 RepID=A0A9N8V6P8_FUNMO|nr:12771_t:CDS:2 [Funneliformis mosseae]
MVVNSHENEAQVLIESELNVSDKNCSYCDKPFAEKLWCKECDPWCMIEGWTSGNSDIDKFIKDTMYHTRNVKGYPRFLEWVPFDRITDIEEIGEGGFAKVYSATWIDFQSGFYKQDDGSWKKYDPEPMKVALKRLYGSREMSAKYFSELKAHWDFYKRYPLGLEFYGITKDSKTKDFIMIKLAYRCMNANPNQRPEADELNDTIDFWHKSIFSEKYDDTKEYGYYGKEIKEAFEEADKEIQSISISRKTNPDAIYTSRAFTFKNLTKPINSSLITSYLEKDENNEEFQDSQLIELGISSSLQLRDVNN